MPRIPRTEAAVPVSYANQPTMDPNALTGPGRALAGLGRAISGLQGAFEGMNEPGDQDVLASQLAAMDAATESQKYFTERQAALTADTDPDTWHQDTTKGLTEIWETNRSRVPNYPKLQQGYEVNKHRFVGQYDVDAHRKATGVKVERFATSAVETFKGALKDVDPTTPQGVAILETVDQQLARVPGLDPVKAQELLAQEVLKGLDASAAADPVQTLDKAKSLSETWGQELRATEPEVLPPGPQSDASGVSRPPDPVSFLTKKLAPGYEQRVADVKDLHPVTQDRLGAFLAEAEEAGHDIRVVSGYRSPARQAVLWRNAVKKYGSPQAARRWVAPPGGSSHQSGEAVDLQFQDRGPGLGGKKSPAVVWAHENAKRFGLHFPLGHEDWHIEPVEARQGGKRYGGNYAKGESLYAKYAGGRTMALGAPGSANDVGAPAGVDPKAVESAVAVANKIGVSPRAVGEVISMESGWNPKQRTGSYMGLTQVGPKTLAEMGVSKAQYLNMSQAEQAAFYGRWLEHYKFSDKVKAAGIDLASLPPARQAAVLQAFQFAPNGDWLKRLGSGDVKTPVTNSPQAKRLGSTSIADMEAYFSKRIGTQTAQSAPDAPAVAQRGLTSYAGLTNPNAPDLGGEKPREVQVADASGAIPDLSSSRIPGPGLSPSEFTQQQKDAQAAASPGQVRPEMPRYKQPSIRTRILDGLAQRMPKYIEAAKRQMTGHIEMAEKSAMEGIVLPPEQATAMQARIEKSGDPELIARWNNANAAAVYTAQLKAQQPNVVQAEAQRLREEIVQGGGTPDQIAKVKAVEGLAATMQKRLSDDSLGWAQEAGVIPPIAPIDAENFNVETLVQRKQAVDAVGQQYGDRYRQFFQSGDEKKFLEVEFAKGGDGMISMMGMMYEAFGDDMPKAVAEIAPKAPEAVRAGYLVSTGGDPKAVEDIAATIRRRADPNFKDTLTLDKTAVVADADQVLGDVFKRYPPELKDATIRTAEAIYMNRATDPTVYDGELFRQSLALAMGQRENANGIKFGGVVMTREGGFLSGSSGDAIVLPSNIRQDTWRDMLDTITLDDLKEAGHPLPADGNGAPVSITKALNGRFVQTGIGKYSVAMGDPDARGSEKWVVNAPPETTAGDVVTTETVASAVESKAGQRFELDMAKLAPILRKKNPEFFWSE